MVGTQTQHKQMPHFRIFVPVGTSGEVWQKNPGDVKRQDEFSPADSHENDNQSHKCQQEPSQRYLLPVDSHCFEQARHSQDLGCFPRAFCHFFIVSRMNT